MGLGPEDHIAKFAILMHLTIATSAVWCKCFPTSLSGLAQQCFNFETILIPMLKQDVEVLALMNGLTRGPFRDSLTKKMSNPLGEALSKADQFIRIEEFNKIAEQIIGEADTLRGKTNLHLVKHKDKKEFIEANPGKPKKKKPQHSPQFEHYSLLKQAKGGNIPDI
ncbi:hypothetical protein Cgig2_017094 [Carnegiea gigantea]|uniref:Uncharacterized protein n=1 Tax=Carnegiea gigantea TaxID=171969 RepID=A0A9Q1QC93_9CARY|nr:hypothetical protein Cgig2_017094 [Carnegiea gigantea]